MFVVVVVVLAVTEDYFPTIVGAASNHNWYIDTSDPLWGEVHFWDKKYIDIG